MLKWAQPNKLMQIILSSTSAKRVLFPRKICLGSLNSIGVVWDSTRSFLKSFYLSGTRTDKTGHVPDIRFWCLEWGQLKLAMFRTSDFHVWNKDRYFVLIRDITVRIPDINIHVRDIIVQVPDITVLIPNINFMKTLTSGIWPVKTGHIPDIDFWCPGYGQFLLAIFRTSSWPYSGHRRRAGYGTWSGRYIGYIVTLWSNDLCH